MTRGDFYSVPKQIASGYPVVSGSRSVCVHIPDDDAFLPVLAAVLAQLGNTWSTVGTVDERRDWARMWQDAYAENKWEECMNCEELQACLAPLLEAQTQEILNLIQNVNNYGTETPGLPVPPEDMTRDIAEGSNPGCDKDITWAQCLALVQYTNAAITNLFEQIEVAANSTELLELLDTVPFLNFITTQAGISGAGAVANYFQEAVTEGYLAQYTPEVENTLACGLFCLFADDCAVNIADIVDYFDSRVAALVPDEPTDLLEFIEIVAGLDFDGTEVVDIMFWFAWKGFELAQFVVTNIAGADKFQELLALSVNDANNDWILLCDCPAEWEYIAELAQLVNWTDYTEDDAGLWSVDGWEANPASGFQGTAIFGIETSLPFLCLSVEPFIDDAMTGTDNLAVAGSLDLSIQFSAGMGAGLNVEIPIEENLNGIAVGYVPDIGNPGSPLFPGATFKVIVKGFGYQPPELGG